jgi:hypothetical protein
MTQERTTPSCADCGAAPIAGRVNGTALCAGCVRTRCERLDEEIAGRQRAKSDAALMDVPAWALEDPEWGAVCWLLTSPTMTWEGAMRFVDFEEREIDWRGLLETSRRWCSSGDLLARVAFNIWNGATPATLNAEDRRGPGTVSALLSQLDGPNFECVLEAMAMARGRRVVVLQAPTPARGAAATEERW